MNGTVYFAQNKQFSWELKGLLYSQSTKRLKTILCCNSVLHNPNYSAGEKKGGGWGEMND